MLTPSFSASSLRKSKRSKGPSSLAAFLLLGRTSGSIHRLSLQSRRLVKSLWLSPRSLKPLLSLVSCPVFLLDASTSGFCFCSDHSLFFTLHQSTTTTIEAFSEEEEKMMLATIVEVRSVFPAISSRFRDSHSLCFRSPTDSLPTRLPPHAPLPKDHWPLLLPSLHSHRVGRGRGRGGRKDSTRLHHQRFVASIFFSLSNERR